MSPGRSTDGAEQPHPCTDEQSRDAQTLTGLTLRGAVGPQQQQQQQQVGGGNPRPNAQIPWLPSVFLSLTSCNSSALSCLKKKRKKGAWTKSAS